VLAVRLAFMLMLAVLVAIAMKVVGILLITSMLIIPAAAARRFAGSPEGMAVSAGGVGLLSVVAGLAASYQWDLPSGPAMVVAATLLFAMSLGAGGVLASTD
jgi:zinc transport system permease protein